MYIYVCTHTQTYTQDLEPQRAFPCLQGSGVLVLLVIRSFQNSGGERVSGGSPRLETLNPKPKLRFYSLSPRSPKVLKPQQLNPGTAALTLPSKL